MLHINRLLGPAVAQDILQLSTSLYSEGGGRAQVVVNADDISHAVSDDIIDGIFLVCSCVSLPVENTQFNPLFS